MSTQLSFSDIPAIERPRYPYERQALAICSQVGDGIFRSLMQIERELGYKYSQAGLSARIRDIRRGVLPGWTSEHKIESGKHFYAVRRAA